jgi:hypothetical protein
VLTEQGSHFSSKAGLPRRPTSDSLSFDTPVSMSLMIGFHHASDVQLLENEHKRRRQLGSPSPCLRSPSEEKPILITWQNCAVCKHRNHCTEIESTSYVEDELTIIRHDSVREESWKTARSILENVPPTTLFPSMNLFRTTWESPQVRRALLIPASLVVRNDVNSPHHIFFSPVLQKTLSLAEARWLSILEETCSNRFGFNAPTENNSMTLPLSAVPGLCEQIHNSLKELNRRHSRTLTITIVQERISKICSNQSDVSAQDTLRRLAFEDLRALEALFRMKPSSVHSEWPSPSKSLEMKCVESSCTPELGRAIAVLMTLCQTIQKVVQYKHLNLRLSDFFSPIRKAILLDQSPITISSFSGSTFSSSRVVRILSDSSIGEPLLLVESDDEEEDQRLLRKKMTQPSQELLEETRQPDLLRQPQKPPLRIESSESRAQLENLLSQLTMAQREFAWAWNSAPPSRSSESTSSVPTAIAFQEAELGMAREYDLEMPHKSSLQLSNGGTIAKDALCGMLHSLHSWLAEEQAWEAPELADLDAAIRTLKFDADFAMLSIVELLGYLATRFPTRIEFNQIEVNFAVSDVKWQTRFRVTWEDSNSGLLLRGEIDTTNSFTFENLDLDDIRSQLDPSHLQKRGPTLTASAPMDQLCRSVLYFVQCIYEYNDVERFQNRTDGYVEHVRRGLWVSNAFLALPLYETLSPLVGALHASGLGRVLYGCTIEEFSEINSYLDGCSVIYRSTNVVLCVAKRRIRAGSTHHAVNPY